MSYMTFQIHRACKGSFSAFERMSSDWYDVWDFRTFSSLRRIKTYLCSMMFQERLDNLALLTIERELSSQLWDSLDELVVEFARSHKNSKIALL